MTPSAPHPAAAAAAARPAAVFPIVPAAAPTATAPAAPPDWRRVLDDAIANDPLGRKGVADKIGVSRVYVSRVASGAIHPVSPRFIARLLGWYERITCPHLRSEITPAQCRSHAQRAYKALEGPAEVEHWRACQRCTVKAPPMPEPTSSFGPDAAERAAQRAAERAAERAAACPRPRGDARLTVPVPVLTATAAAAPATPADPSTPAPSTPEVTA
jgi:transcriptional regulator with XRE-family HTH domain